MVDTLIGFLKRLRDVYAFVTQQTEDAQSKDGFDLPSSNLERLPPRRI
jgi:hypothetical protein